MKRWSALLLLVLLPFTMAPRTSLSDGVDLQVFATVSRDEVRVGQPVNVTLQVRNTSAENLRDARLTLDLRVKRGDAENVALVSTSGSCVAGATTWPLVCELGGLKSGQQRTVSVTLRFVRAALVELEPVATGFNADFNPKDFDPVSSIPLGTGDGA